MEMDMEGFIRANIEAMLEAIDAADVFVIGFSAFPERLLADPRVSERVGPYIAVVQPVSAVEERLRELRQLRPGLPDPQRFVFFVWPRSVASLVECGLWERMMARLRSPRHPAIEVESRRALGALLDREHTELIEAISGRRYRTLWERRKND
ncbi:MAG: hypothetical protein NTZ05_01075 [Chloroflexi bacterium]|nr:hypothetical protein [Chloroflexota bacterium]